MKFEALVVGTVGRDAEVTETSGGKKVAKYSVATRAGKDKTTWVNVSTWNKQAELDGQYVKKGMIISVRGPVQADENGKPRTYTNKEGEVKVSGFEVTGYEVLYLSRVQPAEDASQPGLQEEEIPF